MVKAKFINEGVFYNAESDSFEFDFNKDDKGRDFMYLKSKPYNMKFSSRKGCFIFIGYKIFRNDEHKEVFQKALKSMSIDNNIISQLVSKSILNFGNIYNLQDFDIIITPKSSKPLANFIAKKFSEKIGSNTMLVTDAFVKNLTEDIKLDTSKMSEKAREGLYRMVNKKTDSGVFELKSVHPKFRKFVSNFLIFKNDTTKEVYNRIENGTVLIIDDILTSGASLFEMINQTKNLGAENVIGYTLIAND